MTQCMTKARGLPGPDPDPVLPELTDSQMALYQLCSPAAQASADSARRMLLTSLSSCGWSLAKMARLLGVSKQAIAQQLGRV